MASYKIEENNDDYCEQFLQFELYYDAMSQALGALANKQPEWLHSVIIPIWYPRYAGVRTRFLIPKTPRQCQSLIKVVRKDILYLLDKIDSTGDESLTSVPEIFYLRWIYRRPERSHQ